ncbi:hypothetical protein IU450_31295 [Nocardia abscessus]|uniref:RICIN domain-containing protein n=1 Tax=Nocardia abscessus TaxID=120957 RepID=UPI00189484C0|nr:hypothetical protein [Nocardia abscessus]MBF6340346.1 hypothetical protein [Nocardia abscessus]
MRYRLNGSRLTVYGDALIDGAIVVSVRYALHDHRRQRWTTHEVGKKDGYTVVRIEISDDKDTYCLDAGNAQINSEVNLRIKKSNGSDQQKWCYREDSRGPKIFNYMPYLNTSAALSLRGDFGNVQYDAVVLDRSFSAVSQLWYFNANDYLDEIPN